MKPSHCKEREKTQSAFYPLEWKALCKASLTGSGRAACVHIQLLEKAQTCFLIWLNAIRVVIDYNQDKLFYVAHLWEPL